MTRPMTRRLLGLTAVVACLSAAALLAPKSVTGHAMFFAQSPLAGVRSWEYWLQEYDLPRLQNSPADMLVIDYSRSNPDGGAMIPFARDEVDRLKQRPDGSRRLVVAYLSIGEAEEYRYYWQQAWKANPPDWIIAENCRWPRNHLVRFWDDGWKDIIFRGPQSYLARIKAAGFDGIYIDRIDVYDDIDDRFPDARSRMITFMREMAAEAKSGDGDFLVIAQNAEDLLTDADYRGAIDGIAKEDLLHGVDGTGKRNSAELVSWSRERIEMAQRDGKTVLAVEYLKDAAQVEATRRELAALGIVPVFASRALDGTDPLAPVAAEKPTENYGTPEYGQQNCDGVFKKNN